MRKLIKRIWNHFRWAVGNSLIDFGSWLMGDPMSHVTWPDYMEVDEEDTF
jgi:hypothetical protein